MDEEQLRYALIKQVPAMLGGFSISTSYGDIELEGQDAISVAKLVDKIFTKNLAKLERKKNG